MLDASFRGGEVAVFLKNADVDLAVGDVGGFERSELRGCSRC